MFSEPVAVVARVARMLDDLGVRYLVGGSLASSIYGIPRATQDVDIVAELRAGHVEPFAEALRGEFYVDPAVIREALRRGKSFNVIHLATMFKADVFVAADDPWTRGELARARVESIEIPGGTATLRFASPEDTLLHKLTWYRLGDEVSDRQWGDILGILKIQRGVMDETYLDEWAPRLGVEDLLRRARSQVGAST